MVRLAPLLCAVALFAACPPPRINFGPKGEIDDPEALLKLIADAEGRVLTLSGEAKVRVDTNEAKGSFSMFTAAARPAFLHLEPLDFFGKPQAVLAVNGEEFGLYQAQDNKYYRGPATPQNVSRFLPIVVPAPELVQILLGAVPRVPHDRTELKSDEQCACYVLTLHNGEVTQTLQVHPRNYRVMKSVITGTRAYDLTLDDFGEYGTVSFPRHLVLDAPSSNVHLDLRYTDAKLNESPDLTLFDPTPPEGIEVIQVDPSGLPASGEPPPSGPQLQQDGQ